ncbi:MAG: hypothetical protein MJ229_01955 [bacterium]|nr:hypothetical protein [bacterium]
MQKNIRIILSVFVITLALSFGINLFVKAQPESLIKHSIQLPQAQKTVQVAQPKVQTQVVKGVALQAAADTKTYAIKVNPIEVVNNPKKYLNKKVTITAKFDKFSTLGLDYKPAYRDSEKYITFLIQRSSVNGHVIPLSEMKNFISRKVAEKFIDLKSGDVVEYTGTVFSDALSDTWIDVEKFRVVSSDSVKKDKAE